MFCLAHWLCTFIPILKIVFLRFLHFQSCRFLEQPINPTFTFNSAMGSFVFLSLIQTLGSIPFLFPNKSYPPISILGSKVGVDRTDSLGTGTVVFCVLSGWYSSTRQCNSSTVALDSSSLTPTSNHVI